MTALLALLACTPDPPTPESRPTACNGREDLCARPYDTVTFPGAHNAFAALEDGFTAANANHETGLAAQLEGGIRVLLLDVHYGETADTALCHGPCLLGEIPHRSALALLASFLDANPGEVLTIVYQDEVDTPDLVADLVWSGLDRHAYAHPPGAPWPTLGELVEADTRLIVTAEAGGPPPAWLHHVWDLAWDTPYTFASTGAFTCTANRGDPGADLFLVNHWVSTSLGLPDPTAAAQANSFDVLDARARQCWEESGRRPTWLVVDWWETGDLFAVVDGLNDTP